MKTFGELEATVCLVSHEVEIYNIKGRRIACWDYEIAEGYENELARLGVTWLDRNTSSEEIKFFTTKNF